MDEDDDRSYDFSEGWEKRRVRAHARELRQMRLDRGMTRKHLADEAGVSPSQVERVERGQDARLSTFLKLYNGLGYTARFSPVEMGEEAAGVLWDEAVARANRRETGLINSRRWR